MYKKICVFLLFLIIFLICPAQTFAYDSFVTIVHPVRSRTLWKDKNIQTFVDHASITEKRNIPATWLLQYDVLFDEELLHQIKSLSPQNEIGIFLEISNMLATDAFVPYLIGQGDWARPDMVFLSGYEPSERKKLIDRSMRKFHSIFGYFPTSVGAWYIDAESLKYLRDKYGIQASIICSDQYSTDKYHLWGQYYGTPYYPSDYNTLVPASNTRNKNPIVMMQWAQRDPLHAYGEDVSDSTYSLQANDYAGNHHLSTDYFIKLFNIYAFSQFNDFGQATVGLEVGQEITFLPELTNQVAYIQTQVDKQLIQPVTMKNFSSWFKQRFPESTPQYIITSKDEHQQFSIWYMNPLYRVNFVNKNNQVYVRDFRWYDSQYMFIDAVHADKKTMLFRTIPGIIDELVLRNPRFLYEGIQSFTIGRNGLSTTILFNGNLQSSLLLTEKNVFLPGQHALVSTDRQHVVQERGMQTYYVTLVKMVNNLIALLPSIRYSTINSVSVIGIQISHTSVLGIQFKPFTISILSYPFQSLAHFLRFPKPLVIKGLSDDDLSLVEAKKMYPKSETVIRNNHFIDEMRKKYAQGYKRVYENSTYSLWVK